MPNIKITVAGKIATNTTPDVVIVCGNSDYSVTFDLDAEWAAEATRTARFTYIRDGRTRYKEKTFQGNTVAVPKLSGIRQVTVGLYAGTPDDPGDLHTTTAAAVWCKPSILCGDAAEEITPEEKAGLQSQVDKLAQEVEDLKENGTGGNSSNAPLVTVAKAPVFVNSKDKMVDTGEVYVLVPDGVLWAYMAVDSVELGAELFEIGGIMAEDGTDAGLDKTQNRIRTAKIPCHTEAPISIVCNSNAKWLVHFFREDVRLGKTSFKSTSCDDIVQLYSQPGDVTHVRLLLAYTSDANVTDIPDLLSNVTITQQASGMAWCNTGMAYNQPVDYEDRILAMEAELEVLANGTF